MVITLGTGGGGIKKKSYGVGYVVMVWGMYVVMV
jgi:hypothetical protein